MGWSPPGKEGLLVEIIKAGGSILTAAAAIRGEEAAEGRGVASGEGDNELCAELDPSLEPACAPAAGNCKNCIVPSPGAIGEGIST
jgi:hypothetical protein